MNRFGGIAIAIWLAGILACLILIAHTRFTTDLSAFLPRSPSRTEQVLVGQLRDGVVSRVILLGMENAPPSVLASLSKKLASRLGREKQFVSVNNGQDDKVEKDRKFLWRNRYLLSSDVVLAQFSQTGLSHSLQTDLALLNSDAGPLIKPYLPGDPTGEMLHLADAARSESQPQKKDGVWFSPDGSRALLVAQIAAPSSDVDAQQVDLALVHGAFTAAQRDTPGASTVRLIATGPVVFSVEIRNRIKGDATLFSVIATLLVAAILLAAYRSAAMLFYGLLPVVSGAIAGVAVVSLAFGFVHGITLGFGVTLIGEAVDYPIYLFTQTANGASPKDTLPRIWPTLRLGVLTSICGFGALLFSSFAGLAQLGVFSITGLICAVCVTRWVLPALLPFRLDVHRPALIGARLRGLVRGAPRLRVPALALSAVALLFFTLHRGTIWDDALASLSPISKADKLADQELRTQLGAPDVGYLLIVRLPTLQGTLEATEHAAATLRRLVARHNLAGFESPATYLPSKATQERRQSAIPARAELAARLAQALRTTPFQPDTFAPFLDQAAAARTSPLIDRSSLKGTSFEPLVDSLLVHRRGTWQAMIALRGVTHPQNIAKAIAHTGIPGLVFLDIKRASNALYGTCRRQSVLLALCGALAIILFLFVSLRQPARVARVLTPLVLAVLMTMAILVVAGEKLTIFHLVGLLLVAAVGSNYSLFFERKWDAGDEYGCVIASLVLANMCTVTGFGVLSFSGIAVLHGIGLTVAVGAFLSLVFSAIFSKQTP